jgi:hypothetical protein
MTAPQWIPIAAAALILFLPGVPPFMITMIPLFACAILLFLIKKGGGRSGTTNAQTFIVITALLLVLISGLFPPYYVPEYNEAGKIVCWHVEWEFNKDLHDLLKGHGVSETPDGILMHLHFIEANYMYAIETQRLEIFGILVLAGVGILITKKRST